MEEKEVLAETKETEVTGGMAESAQAYICPKCGSPHTVRKTNNRRIIHCNNCFYDWDPNSQGRKRRVNVN